MLKLLTSYSIAFSILAATLQVPVYFHTCYVLGITESSLYAAQHCADEVDSDSSNEKVQNKCCSLNMKTYKADLQTHPVKSFFSSIFSVLVNDFVEVDVTPASFAVANLVRLRPPPDLLFNRTLLHFIQVLRL